MIAISEKFKMLRSRGEAALIPFITAGDPDLETTIAALEALDRAGADLIELGIPYADPLADGPVIQAAATRALQKGTNLGAILAVLEQVKGKISAPLIIFPISIRFCNRVFLISCKKFTIGELEV